MDAPKKEAHDVGLLCAGFEGGKGKAPQKRRGGLQCPRRLVLIRLAFAAMRPYGFLAGRRAGLGKEVGGAGSKFAWDEVHTCGGGVRRNAVECSEDLTNVSFPPTRLWAEPPPHTCDCEGGPPRRRECHGEANVQKERHQDEDANPNSDGQVRHLALLLVAAHFGGGVCFCFPHTGGGSHAPDELGDFSAPPTFQ